MRFTTLKCKTQKYYACSCSCKQPWRSHSNAKSKHWDAKRNKITHNGSTNCNDFAAPKPDLNAKAEKQRFWKRRHVPTGLKDLLRHVPTGLKDLSRHVPTGLEDLLRHVPTGLKDLLRHVPTGLEDLLKHVPTGLKDLWRHVPTGLNDLLSHMPTGLNDLWATRNVKVRNSEFLYETSLDKLKGIDLYLGRIPILFHEFLWYAGSGAFNAFNGPPVLGPMHAGEWKDNGSTREVGPEQGRWVKKCGVFRMDVHVKVATSHHRWQISQEMRFNGRANHEWLIRLRNFGASVSWLVQICRLRYAQFWSTIMALDNPVLSE